LHIQSVLFVACIAGACIPASAALIYNNGGPNHLGGSDMVLSLEADDFTVAAQSTLTTAQFWDFETPGGGDYAGSISWFIYSNSANNPGSVLFSGSASGAAVTRAATGIFDPSLQFTEFSDTFTFGGGVTLSAGVYWLGLHNGPTSPVDPNSLANFAWENTSTSCTETAFNVCGRAQDLTSPGSPFLSTLTENAFNISGSPVTGTPEPASLPLFASGFASLVLLPRRSRCLLAKLWRNR
jgi:hypothetical protein